MSGERLGPGTNWTTEEIALARRVWVQMFPAADPQKFMKPLDCGTLPATSNMPLRAARLALADLGVRVAELANQCDMARGLSAMLTVERDQATAEVKRLGEKLADQPRLGDSINRHFDRLIIEARAERDAAHAEIAHLRALTSTCSCDTGPHYEGPQADCPVHGAVRGLREAVAEIERLKAELAEERTAFGRREEYLQRQVDAQHASAQGWSHEVQVVRAEHSGCPHLYVTFDGDTHWLACFAADPDGEHGDPIHGIDAGDAWGDLLTKVAEHRCTSPEATQ